MSVDIGEAFDEMAQIVASDTGIEEGIGALIDGCASRCQDSIWESFRTLNFASDIATLNTWLTRTLTNEPPAKGINGFWFGLFNPILEDGAASSCLYISGSTRYSPNDVDWAIWKEDSYLPEDKYAESEIMRDIYRAVQALPDGDCATLAEYMLCLGYSALVLRDFFRSADTNVTLGKGNERTVVVGFDSGDYLEVGKVDQRGWHLNSQQ